LVNAPGAQAAIKQALRTSTSTVHVDETGINIAGKRSWLHGASDLRWTYFFPHKRIGKEAMDDANILAHFQEILCHDHWKPYYQYTDCKHALCNAHHLRELERAWEHVGMQWAKAMQTLLTRINQAQIDNGFIVDSAKQTDYRLTYQQILADGILNAHHRMKKHEKKGSGDD
jgi:transposase